MGVECQGLGLGKRGDGPKWAPSVSYTMRVHLGDLKYSVLIIILYLGFAKKVDFSYFHYKEKGNCGGGSRVKAFKNVHRYSQSIQKCPQIQEHKLAGLMYI